MAEKLKAHYPAEGPAARSDGPAPAALLARLEEQLLLLQTNMGRAKDIDGTAWEAEPQNTGNYHPSLKVWHSRPSRTKVWRIKCSGACADAAPDAVYGQLCVNEQKMTWDHESVGWTRRTRSFAGSQPRDRVDVESYISLPHLAGLVKPRCFYETRLTRWQPDGSIWSAVVFLDEKDPWHAACGGPEFEALAKAAGFPRGKNQPGSGMVFEPEGGGTRFTMVAQTELGGWLPQSPVNNATGEVLAGISRDCIRVVSALPAEQRAAAALRTPTPPADADGESAAASSAVELTPAPSPSSTVASRASADATPPPRRTRRRIRVPGCRDESRYAWRWVVDPAPAPRGAAAAATRAASRRGA